MDDPLIYFNGINADTGEYAVAPMSPRQLSEAALSAERDAVLARALAARQRQAGSRGHLGVKEGVDVRLLDQAGWGVVFAYPADPAIEEALSDLLALRRHQAGARFRTFKGGEERGGGLRSGESKTDWLARNGMEPGPADPDRVPYYLLIVGNPQDIPYTFQYEMGVQYAVGRLHFETVDEYAAYARGVIAAEQGEATRDGRAVFFGVSHEGDPATRQAVDRFIVPLSRALSSAAPAWQVDTVVDGAATKASLAALVSGPSSPALLVTSSHGMEYRRGDGRQRSLQGALLCSDWPGHSTATRGRPVPPECYFAADDVTASTDVRGLLGFVMACYGAGSPGPSDRYHRNLAASGSGVSDKPFLAALPQRLLGHPRGGALAVIGHIERAWSYSYAWPGTGAGTTAFESTLRRLLDGYPAGAAVDYLHLRWAELSTVLTQLIADAEAGGGSPQTLARMWTAAADARGYVILGDPAVRLSRTAP
jgi:hypothetical protein